MPILGSAMPSLSETVPYSFVALLAVSEALAVELEKIIEEIESNRRIIRELDLRKDERPLKLFVAVTAAKFKVDSNPGVGDSDWLKPTW
jgi:hypothetical protein